jgi:hypothetical protein
VVAGRWTRRYEARASAARNASRLWLVRVNRVELDQKVCQRRKAVKYKRVVISRKGGPEVLQVVEEELAEPGAGEVRVKSAEDQIIKSNLSPSCIQKVSRDEAKLTPHLSLTNPIFLNSLSASL